VRRMKREPRARLVLGAALAAGFAAGPALSEPRVELRAAMNCQTEPGSGRLVCTIEFAPPAEHRIAWCDALVVSAPPVATPLRARVRGAKNPPRAVLGFVLGSGAGGRIEVLARAVACPAKPLAACASLSTSVGFEVEERR
jgi:hypothetical protein